MTQAKWLGLLKILLSAGLIVVVFRYFFHFENLDDVWTQIYNLPFLYFALALLFAGINWGIESRKWQILVSNLEQWQYPTAVKSTFAGAAVSNILPFRIGEYLGRIVFLKPENRIPAAFNSVFGSTWQFVVSLVFGIPAVIWVMDRKYHTLVEYALLSLFIILLVLFFVFRYFRKHKNFRFKWIVKLGNDIRKFTTRQIFLVIWLSLLRYLVFSSFYVILLLKYEISTDILWTYAAVASVYFLQSFAPSMILTDAGLRTALPLLVLHPPAALESSLLAAALINYLFNILLPSFTGLYFVIRQKIKAT